MDQAKKQIDLFLTIQTDSCQINGKNKLIYREMGESCQLKKMK